MKRVVITGMGIWSCLGTTLDEVRDSLYSGRSGIVLDPARKEMGFRSGLTAALPLPDLKAELPANKRESASKFQEKSRYVVHQGIFKFPFGITLAKRKEIKAIRVF